MHRREMHWTRMHWGFRDRTVMHRRAMHRSAMQIAFVLNPSFIRIICLFVNSENGLLFILAWITYKREA